MSTSLKLLVIEDSLTDYQLLERHLRQHGLEAECHRVDSNEGLAEALRKSWDLVLSDYQVPGMNFLVTLGRLHSHNPDLPVILVSGTVGEEIAVDLLRHGAWDFVLKDNLTRLVTSIQRCLEEAAGRGARRAAEQALAANEAKFRAYFEHAPILLLVLDAQGRHVDINPRARKTLGYTPLGLGFAEIMVEGERERAERDLARLQEYGHIEGEYGLRRHDNATLWVALRANRIAPDRYIAYAEDITARRLADEHLRLMATVFNATQEGLAITDLEGRVQVVNAAFSKITEYPEAEIIGRRLNILSSGRHKADFYQTLWWSLRSIGYWQGEIWNRRKGGDIYLQWLTISTVSGASGMPEKYVAVFTDISHIKHATAHLEYLAHHDALTDLPNRLVLLSRLEYLLEHLTRNGGQGALLHIDIDDFKAVNQHYGHLVGDEVLKQAALRLRGRLRQVDTLARLGSDEFMVAIDGVAETGAAAGLATEIMALLAQPIELANGAHVELTCSIGICLIPGDGDRIATLLECADAARLQVRRDGGNGYRFHGA